MQQVTVRVQAVDPAGDAQGAGGQAPAGDAQGAGDQAPADDAQDTDSKAPQGAPAVAAHRTETHRKHSKEADVNGNYQICT